MSTRTADEERILAFATEMYERVVIPFDATLVDRYFAPDYIQHGSLARDGRDGLRAFLDQARRDFPDAEIAIRRSFVDGDHVIFHVSGQLGPQHRPAAIVDMFRIQEGAIQEHWEVIQELPESVPHDNGSF